MVPANFGIQPQSLIVSKKVDVGYFNLKAGVKMKNLAMFLFFIDLFVWSGVTNAEYTIIPITDNSVSDFRPAINNRGHIAWSRKDGAEYTILVYDGKIVHQIKQDSLGKGVLEINDNDDVLYYGAVPGSDSDLFYIMVAKLSN